MVIFQCAHLYCLCVCDSRRTVKGKATASGAQANGGDRDSSLAIVPGDPTAPNNAGKNASYVAQCLRMFLRFNISITSLDHSLLRI
jgi:hypothetical protein